MSDRLPALSALEPDAAPRGRDVRRLRGPRVAVDPDAPVAVWDEWEVAAAGHTVPTRVVILAGAECRFTCAMCDLWRHTLPGPTAPGRLPRQIREALQRPWSGDGGVAVPRWIKLYNGSNFFDPRSVPEADWGAITAALAPCERVVVENHPTLVDDRVPRFRDRCPPRLEVAMGLETVCVDVLARLGKQMTLADFTAACGRLQAWGVDIRSFVLLGLPWSDPTDAVDWCGRSVVFAIEHGARHVSIVPTRPGNGYLDALAARGRFTPPDASVVEAAAERLVPAGRGTAAVVTIDLWDWPRLAGTCAICRSPRRARLERMNALQAALPPVSLDCGCRQ